VPASTVRAIDLRYLERWAAARRKPALTLMGVDEIHLGKKQKFITVVSHLESGEPVWFGRERKKEILDEFFRTGLSAGQRMRISAACVDMWEPFRMSIEQWAPRCRIVYDKFHIMQHANQAIDEVRRAEFFRKGGQWRGLVRQALAVVDPLGKPEFRQAAGTQLVVCAQPQALQSLCSQREPGAPLNYRYEGAMLNYLQRWMGQLRWQRLRPFEKLAHMLLTHLQGILNYCRTKVPLGMVEAINGNIKSLLRRGRGYQNLRYLLLKAQRMAATRTEFVVFRKAA
jgi:transposase